MRTLIVEDSKRLAESVRAGLRKLGHAVDVAHDGVAGLSYARTNPYDVIILDVLMPGLDGLTVLQKLRESGHETRVLVLSAKDTIDDRVAGFRLGADDYLVKPFAFDELVARLDALGRRPPTAAHAVLQVGDLEIDTTRHVASRSGHVIELTPREFALLALLASRPGKVVTRIEIEDQLYDERTFPVSNAVETAVSRLRSRLDAPGARARIRTRRGVGYVLDDGSQ